MAAEIIDEVSGVFEATLNEDMADTVVRVKRPYIDCFIPEVFDKDQPDYPLVYLPAWYATYPLKKGDKVLVYFNQGCLRYPVLWKIPTEYESDFTKSLTFPANGSLVQFPSVEKVTAVKKLTEGCYVYVTDRYTLIRNSDEFYLISSDGSVQNYTSLQVLCNAFKLEVKQSFDIQVHGPLSLKVDDSVEVKSTGVKKVSIGNSLYGLKQFADDILNCLISAQTMGSPAVHTMSPATITKLAEILNHALSVFQ